MKAGDTILKRAFEELPELTAKVNWVVGNTMGVSYLSPEDWKGSCNQMEMVEGEWIVIAEGPSNFKSEIEGLSDAELQAKVEELRGSRRVVTPVRVTKSPALSADEKALASLTPEQMIALKKVLGL